MNRSLAIAAAVTLGAVGWVLSGQIGGEPIGGGPSAPVVTADDRAAPPPAKPAPPTVRVHPMTARPMLDAVTLQGRTEAWRTVGLRAEVRGRVDSVPVARGRTVAEGDVLVRLAVNDREAQLRQAQALLAQRRIEFEAASALNRRGNASDVQLATARAQLDAAEAVVRKAEVDLANTVIRAPFAGVLDERPVEIGDFLDVGNPVATVVDLDPVRVVGHATERHVAELRVGAPGSARIVGVGDVEGRIAYVAATADAVTRTFRVELEVPNPDHRIVAGLSAQLRLPLAERTAHFVPPSVLSLADDGTVGVKVVGAGDRVRFLPVEILGTTPDGVWLGGLPAEIRLIGVGHEYVAAGNRVTPVTAAGGAT